MSGGRREHPWGLVLASALIVPPLIAVCYYLAGALAEQSAINRLQFAWEKDGIPFVPAMAGPYLSLYPLLLLGIALVRGRRELWRLVGALMLGTILCGVLFVLFPTYGHSDAQSQASGIWKSVYEHIDRLDNRYCWTPSLHVVLAGVLWVHFAVVVRRPWRWMMHAWFVLLIASTLLTHEHYVIDVFSGACVAAVCIVLCGVGGRRSQIRFWRRLRSRRKMSIAPGPNSQSAVTTPNDTPVQVPRSQ